MEISRFEQLIKINGEAFEEGHYNTAYHALSAALFCAQDENDIPKALMVMHIAETQARWIDENCPQYQHSSQSASNRGINNGGIYVMLVRQAASIAELMKPPRW